MAFWLSILHARQSIVSRIGRTSLTIVVIGPIASPVVGGVQGRFGSLEQRDGIVALRDLPAPTLSVSLG